MKLIRLRYINLLVLWIFMASSNCAAKELLLLDLDAGGLPGDNVNCDAVLSAEKALVPQGNPLR